MSNTILKFVNNTGTTEFSVQRDVFFDPTTNEPYKYAKVHGKTWQTNFFSEMPDLLEAFTPCPSEYNHRGFYEWCPKSQAYVFLSR